MTIAYPTAGLGVQDTETPEPTVLTAYTAAGLPPNDLPHTGYHLYVAAGGLNDIDFTTPDRLFPVGASGSVIGYGFAASTTYTTVLRPVKDDLETPDISALAEFVTDAGAEWVGLRPDPIRALTAEKRSGGVIRLEWQHRLLEGATPDDFQISYGTTPAATGTTTEVTYTGARKYTKDLTLSDGVTYWFKITARDGTLASTPLRVGGITADSTAPSAPSITTATTWQPQG